MHQHKPPGPTSHGGLTMNAGKRSSAKSCSSCCCWECSSKADAGALDGRRSGKRSPWLWWNDAVRPRPCLPPHHRLKAFQDCLSNPRDPDRFHTRRSNAVDERMSADSGSRTHDIRLETSDDNHFTISAILVARSIPSLSQSVAISLESRWRRRYWSI